MKTDRTNIGKTSPVTFFKSEMKKKNETERQHHSRKSGILYKPY